MSEIFFSKVLDENGVGLDIWWVVRVGIGGTSGMDIDDLETFRLSYLES
jgi:hypothetical protein